ncbi:MAG: hypothetical protein ACKPA7_16535, partial [Sphaerospermopsis kisseleviana]
GYATWCEPHKPSDKYIKSARLLSPRIKEIFPKITITQLRPEGSSKSVPHIVGITVPLPPKQIVFCTAPDYIPPAAVAKSPQNIPQNIPQNTPNIPQNTPNIPQNENGSKPDTPIVSRLFSTPNTPNCSNPLEKNSKEEIDRILSAGNSQSKSDDIDDTEKNIERLDDFGVFGVGTSPKTLATQEIQPNNFGVYLGDNLGDKAPDFGVFSRIKVADADPQQQKRDEFKQQQNQQNNEILNQANLVLNFLSRKKYKSAFDIIHSDGRVKSAVTSLLRQPENRELYSDYLGQLECLDEFGEVWDE